MPLDRRLRSQRPVPIKDLMEAERRRVPADEDQEVVARLFQRYDLVAAPVVDANERLVGVITFDDVAGCSISKLGPAVFCIRLGLTADSLATLMPSAFRLS